MASKDKRQQTRQLFEWIIIGTYFLCRTCWGQRGSGSFGNCLISEEWEGGGWNCDIQVIMRIYKYAWNMTGTWSTGTCGATDCSLTWSPSPSQVTGVVLLSVGLWWKFMLGPYMLLISNSPSNGPYVLIGTGVAIVLFGLFGCFATCKGRPWMLKLVRFHDFSNRCARWGDWCPTLYSLQYAVFLALVFMTELIAGISGFIFRHEVMQKKTIKTAHTVTALSPWQHAAFMPVGVCTD